MRHLLCPVLLFVAASVSLGAEPPKVGEQAPDFALTNLDGEKVRLAELTEDGPVVVLMLRGYPGYQCPLCSRQVGAYLSKAEQFEQKGAQVLLVYPGPAADLPELGREFLGERMLPEHFHFVLDADFGFTLKYGLRWDKPAETAYPSTFVIGEDGKVLYRKISRTHGDRSKPEDVLAELPGQ